MEKVSDERSNSVESSTRKGFGLKKWRRIKRDTLVKEEAAASPVDDGSKLLKRGLTGLVNPPCKHVDLSLVEARQSSEGSVGSVNMVVKDHHLLVTGVVNGFSPMFNVGQGFEKSGDSISAKNVGGGGKDTTIKNGSEKRERKPCSSIDSDLRSSDFVFSSGTEKDERLMLKHIGEDRSENGGKDEDGDESKKKNTHYWVDKDHVADSITSLAALQEALWKEVTSFKELSKESISQVLILKQTVKHLQHKLEEARADLISKEAKIQELENSKIESELEGIFKRKIEAEIEHLLLTRSLSSSLQVLKQQPKKVHSVTEDPEQNRGDILGKTCKSSFYFLIQLILLVSIVQLLLHQSSPASRLVIPT